LKEHLRVLVDPKIGEHRGRVVKNTGDGMLAEFDAALSGAQRYSHPQHCPIQTGQTPSSDRQSPLSCVAQQIRGGPPSRWDAGRMNRSADVSFWHLCTEANYVQFGRDEASLWEIYRESGAVEQHTAGHSFWRTWANVRIGWRSGSRHVRGTGRRCARCAIDGILDMVTALPGTA
jgi:class 3 adenylate cyclase